MAVNSSGHRTAASGNETSGPAVSDKLSELPLEFGPGQSEVWCVSLDSGHSSPVIAGEFIFLTTYQESTKTLSVVCLDRATGKIQWQQPVKTDAIEKGHPSFNPASSTPATDGERVVAYFGSYGLVCFDVDGNLLWERQMPLTKSYAGNATSPIIVGDRVFLYRGNLIDHFLLAVDKHTGETIWKIDQEEPFHIELACTACPIVYENQLIVHSARSVQSFDILSGSRIWMTKCATTATSTPVLAGNEVLVAAWNKMGEPALRPEFPSYAQLLANQDRNKDGQLEQTEFPKLWIFHRPEGIEAPENGAPLSFRSVDKNRNGILEEAEWTEKQRDIEKFRGGYQQHGLLAVPLEAKGVLEASQVRVLERRGIPEVPSPLYHNGLAYLAKNGGMLTVVDVASGKRVGRVRTGGKGTHYASPLIANGKLWIASGDGTISVLSLGKSPRLLANNTMSSPVYATPAIVGDTLYVRTHTDLHAFRQE